VAGQEGDMHTSACMHNGTEIPSFLRSEIKAGGKNVNFTK